MIWAVRRLRPPERECVAQLVRGLFGEKSEELVNSRKLVKAADVQNVHSMIVRQTMPFDPEEKPPDDPGCRSVNPFAIEHDGALLT